ncbi:MAG: hypothetical protein R6U96_17375 [Promethearchaeia archaeon]
MTTANPVGYCPHCKQKVLMKKKDFDICLGIVLSFTGIGIIFYLIYYYAQDEIRCVHCNSICKPLDYQEQEQELDYQEPAQDQLPPSSATSQNTVNYQPEVVESVGNSQKHCPFCGSKLDNRDQKFCANCGSNLE